MKRLVGVSALSVFSIIWSATVSVGQPQLPPPPNLVPNQERGAESEEPDVYTRGALHEAFATPSSNDPIRTPVLNREAPAPIEELPPEDKPEGDNVVWIPGYWAFDDELDDFIWISGLWRDVPPDREWVPGYWAPVQGGFQWIPGMWKPIEQQEIAYYPEPPVSQERGPSSPSPGENYFYVPGHWEYRNQFVWAPGYWAPRQLEWIWVSARWVWTPYGFCFIPGHWDFLLVERGLCYAPVYFHHHHIHRPRPYRPVCVLNTWDQFTMHLFVQPTHGCYVFGNYYGRPRDRYVPWFQYQSRRGHDSLFAYYSWRNGPDYGRRLDRWHNHFEHDERDRPAVTLREQVRIVNNSRSTTNVRVNLAINLANRDRDRGPDRDIKLPVKLTKVTKDEDVRLRTRVENFRELQQKRVKLEVADNAKPGDGKPGDRGPSREAGPKKLTLDIPRDRDRERVEQPKFKLPEAPDKLKNVKPDSPNEKEARVPSPRRRPGLNVDVKDSEAIPDLPKELEKEAPKDPGNRRPGREVPDRNRGNDKPQGDKPENDKPPMRERPSREKPGDVPKIELPKKDSNPTIPRVKPPKEEPKNVDPPRPPKREKPPMKEDQPPRREERPKREPKEKDKDPKAALQGGFPNLNAVPSIEKQPRIGNAPIERRDVNPVRELKPRSNNTNSAIKVAPERSRPSRESASRKLPSTRGNTKAPSDATSKKLEAAKERVKVAEKEREEKKKGD